MLASVLDNPDVYEEGVAELLQEMVYKGRGLDELTEQERGLLDRAALDLASDKRPRPPAPKPHPPRHQTRQQPKALQAAKGELPSQASSSSGPLEIPKSPPTFWWRDRHKKKKK